MNPLLIPFNCAGFVGKEMEYIRQAVESGHLGGDGPFSQRCHALLEKELGINGEDRIHEEGYKPSAPLAVSARNV